MAGRAIEVRIAPLHHSLPNAGDAAMSQKHPSDLPGWSRAATVEKIQPRARAAGSSSAPRGAAPHRGGGAVGLWGCGAGAACGAGAVPSAHALHRRLATCSAGRSWRGALRLGSRFAPLPPAGFSPRLGAVGPIPGGGSGFPWLRRDPRPEPRSPWAPLGRVAASPLAWGKPGSPAATGSVMGLGSLRSEGQMATKGHPGTCPTPAGPASV